MPRWLTTALIIAVAALLTWAMFQSNSNSPAIPEDPPTTQTPPDGPGSPGTPDTPDTPGTQPPDAPKPPTTDPGTGTPNTPDAPDPSPEPTTPVDKIEGLKVIGAVAKQADPTIGGTEFDESVNPYVFEARFTQWGAAVRHIKLARYSSSLKEHNPLVLQEVATINEGGRKKGVYPMAVQAVTINGQTLLLWNQRWNAGEITASEDGVSSVTFTIEIADASDKPVLRIERTWRASPGRYDLRVSHNLVNLSDKPLDVALQQLGPVDLPGEMGYMGDKRNVTIATLRPLGQGDTNQQRVSTDGYRLDRASVIDGESAELYPGAKYEPNFQLLWAAMDNRYFTVVTHGVVDPERIAVRPIEGEVGSISRVVWGSPALEAQYKTLGFTLDGTTNRIDAGKSRAIVFDIYAGPKEPKILKEKEEYVALKMGDLVVYNLGGFCAFCTFEFLATGLMGFLQFIQSIVADWGVAIICLVAVVRLILHPLTKRSQINMMKVSKQMQALQPEMAKIKEKYADNKEKLNAETMKLYREKGVNPAAMGLGCLPMFLQMPIWFALYAMLYFAIELRHEPAFYGVFQSISSDAWMFLADLSSRDGFIPLPESMQFNLPALGLIDAINILPLLMGFVFFLQQKYTTAATPPASEQAAQQQKMMKWMTLLFPVFLYNAPSGLTLYILTSTTVGVIESRRVRAHLKELEDSGELYKKKETKPGGFMDRLSKAVEAKQKEAAAKKGGSPAQSAGPKLPTDKKKKKRRGKGGNRF